MEVQVPPRSTRSSMTFCPCCASLLLIKRAESDGLQQVYCQACPYMYALDRPLRHKTLLVRKQVDDVLGGAEAWKNVDQTDATCPKCAHGRAYYMQIQIRSADEPSSLFFKCVGCAHQWREG